jgi:anti-sigma regulatory factor (Ser/Thr protein kinase)
MKKMNRKNIRNTWFLKNDSTIQFNGKLNSFNVKDVCASLNLFRKSSNENLTLDFSRVLQAYPNGVLPIISSITEIRNEGYQVYVKLPTNDNVRRLFRSVNWAHFLSPEQFEKSESTHDRHLVTRIFFDEKEQTQVVNDFMDVVLRSMEVPKDILSGLEWSINELTDNVLNHSKSKSGGFVQASTYPTNGVIAFAVADSGRGILNSLKEGFPTLRTDVQAIGEAVKAGVTRNPKYGQGNGLAGSLRVATLTGGSLEVTSGQARILSTQDETKKNDRRDFQLYQGTLVCGQINITNDFSISKALNFGMDANYEPGNVIDYHYEMENEDCLILHMKKETTGFGTRRSGKQINTKINNLITAKPDFPMVVDWEGIPVISSSFADEMIGKLFIKLGAISFSSLIRNVNMEPLIRNLLDKAIAQRLTQAIDED